MAVLDEIDAIWRTELFGEGMVIPPVAVSLCQQSFFFWLAAVRVALSGHSSAMYPVLRLRANPRVTWVLNSLAVVRRAVSPEGMLTGDGA